VRPEDQPKATNSAFSGTFGNCGGGIGRFFLKILLKSGTYGRVMEQDMRQNLFAGAQTPDGDSHRIESSHRAEERPRAGDSHRIGDSHRAEERPCAGDRPRIESSLRAEERPRAGGQPPTGMRLAGLPRRISIAFLQSADRTGPPQVAGPLVVAIGRASGGTPDTPEFSAQPKIRPNFIKLRHVPLRYCYGAEESRHFCANFS
jgi:hypothetical protein